MLCIPVQVVPSELQARLGHKSVCHRPAPDAPRTPSPQSTVSYSDPCDHCFPSTCSASLYSWLGRAHSQFRSLAQLLQSQDALLSERSTAGPLSCHFPEPSITSAWATLSCSKALSLTDRRAWFCYRILSVWKNVWHTAGIHC